MVYHDETLGVKPMFFSENALKLTYDNVWVKKNFLCSRLLSAPPPKIPVSVAEAAICIWYLV
jgi:hypothetical protein